MAKLCDNGMDIATCYAQRRDRRAVEGTLAPAKVDPLQSEGPVKGTCMGDVLSTAQQQVENVRCKSDKVRGCKPAVDQRETCCEVEVSLNVSIPQAAVDESLHVSDKEKVPKKILHTDRAAVRNHRAGDRGSCPFITKAE